MSTLLLRLEGPMQSWGTISRFMQRDTGYEPSKSGVIGLLACACGFDRDNWSDIEPITRLRMGVRHERPGSIRREYQSAGCAKPKSIINAQGELMTNGVISERFYIEDASFLVGLEGSDDALLQNLHSSLKNPRWTLFLGRKSYVPSVPVWIPDGLRVNENLEEALYGYRLDEMTSDQILFSFESNDQAGRMVFDQPLSSFSERRFGTRFVQTEWKQIPKGVGNVSA